MRVFRLFLHSPATAKIVLPGTRDMLSEALKEFERGVKLMRDCQTTLKEAEQTVEILLKKTADADAEPFEPDDAGD